MQGAECDILRLRLFWNDQKTRVDPVRRFLSDRVEIAHCGFIVQQYYASSATNTRLADATAQSPIPSGQHQGGWFVIAAGARSAAPESARDATTIPQHQQAALSLGGLTPTKFGAQPT
jgi:hypothetical protein